MNRRIVPFLCGAVAGAAAASVAWSVSSGPAAPPSGPAVAVAANVTDESSVEAMIDAAVANGQPVLAAVNADFFDMWGDCSPSGMCVKNGQVVANADSLRPFVGVKRDGTPVIASLAENPELLPELYQAAAGLQRILRGGKLDEWGPLEPFAYVRHPRTAVGLRADGTLLCLEVDGRIPDYSNGATLVDLAILLRKFGAEDAINLDGGGSSVVYTKGETGYELRTNPADLYRPTEKLIREEFNCLLITENTCKTITIPQSC